MKLHIRPKWYGSGKEPRQTFNESRMVREYQNRLEEKRRRGDPKGGFNPVEGPYAELYHKEVLAVQSSLKKDDVVLDVGAGEGRFVEIALQRGAKKVIALDPDQIAIEALRRQFKANVEVVQGFAQNMYFLADKSVDIAVFTGNSLGVMWDIIGNWKELICRQKEALLEMIRVARRAVVFTVYGKVTTESSLKAYEPLYRNVIDTIDGLMLIEEHDNKPHLIKGSDGNEVSRFIFQKFDRLYLENLLADCGVQRQHYSIENIPDGKEYGYLVTIDTSLWTIFGCNIKTITK